MLYIGVTNNLKTRLHQHQQNVYNSETFTGKYYCYKLLFYERFERVKDAIAREKQIKRWSRKKKEFLINSANPKQTFLNEELFS